MTNLSTILVVEDDRLTRAIIQKILTQAGFQTAFAENGKLGLELAKIHQPSLIISDLYMPEMSGFEMCQILHQDPATAAIPFIFLSGSSGDFTAQALPNPAAISFLAKPFTRDELVTAVQVHFS